MTHKIIDDKIAHHITRAIILGAQRYKKFHITIETDPPDFCQMCNHPDTEHADGGTCMAIVRTYLEKAAHCSCTRFYK